MATFFNQYRRFPETLSEADRPSEDFGIRTAFDQKQRLSADERFGAEDPNAPVHLAAEVYAKRARYLHLVLDLRPEHRGVELTAENMDRFGARIVEYRVSISEIEFRPIDFAIQSARIAFLSVKSASDRLISQSHLEGGKRPKPLP